MKLVLPHIFNKLYTGFDGMLFLSFLVSFLYSLVVQLVCYTSSPLLFSIINLSLSSFLLLRHSCRGHATGVGVFFLERVVVVVVKAAHQFWGRGRVISFSPPYIYTPYKRVGCLGAGLIRSCSCFGYSRISYPSLNSLLR
jgi:hypothetical protein